MKTRLTITLDDTVLTKVDQIIDKKKIRNRSHAIEQLIVKSLQPTIDTAIILAGGEFSEIIKPLTILDGKPLILYTIDLLKKHQVKNILIATNNRGQEIKQLLKNGDDLEINISYFFEEKPLGTAGAIKNINQKKLLNKPFFVISGDILTNINLTDLAKFHNTNQAMITMAVKPRPTNNSYHNVFVQGHTVVDFQTSKQNQIVSIVNAGVYIFNPKLIQYIPEKTPSMLEKDVFPKLSQTKKILAYPFQGVWFDISTDTNYQKALKKID